MVTTILTVLAVLVIGAATIDIIKGIKGNFVSILKNDLSNDYSRWSPSDIAIAGYIGIFVSDEIRLNDYFQSLIYAVLSRSERAVDEKVRRISTVGTEKSDASVADQDIAFLLSSYSNEDAKVNFLNDLYTAGASAKQVKEISAYL
tara:strand:- start:1941 stop:2378 length:438 start_codon:yes stop_codon:yes gene_type:complete